MLNYGLDGFRTHLFTATGGIFFAIDRVVAVALMYDRINIRCLRDKLKTTYLPGQAINVIQFMDKKIVCLYLL